MGAVKEKFMIVSNAIIVISGAVILVLGLIFALRIVGILRDYDLARPWIILSILISFFFLGYVFTALRLLARVVSDIWKRKEEDVHLILPAYVALDVQEIRDELTGKLKLLT